MHLAGNKLKQNDLVGYKTGTWNARFQALAEATERPAPFALARAAAAADAAESLALLRQASAAGYCDASCALAIELVNGVLITRDDEGMRRLLLLSVRQAERGPFKSTAVAAEARHLLARRGWLFDRFVDAHRRRDVHSSCSSSALLMDRRRAISVPSRDFHVHSSSMATAKGA